VFTATRSSNALTAAHSCVHLADRTHACTRTYTRHEPDGGKGAAFRGKLVGHGRLQDCRHDTAVTSNLPPSPVHMATVPHRSLLLATFVVFVASVAALDLPTVNSYAAALRGALEGVLVDAGADVMQVQRTSSRCCT
jgi:hypothetical protein